MKSRIKFLIGGVIIFAVIAFLAVIGLQESTVFFYTPKEILAAPASFESKTIRIGALVQRNSVKWDAQKILLTFDITDDMQHFIPVVYSGIKPDMFQEGQGVVVEGQINHQVFHAKQLLVKHSEDYKVSAKEPKSKEDYYKSLVLP